MSWLSVSFEMAASDVEAVTDALLAGGALSVDVTDADAGSAGEQAVFAEPGAGPLPVWRRSLVSALVAGDADPAALLAGACAQAGLELPPHHVRRVAEQDWVRAARSQFAPVRISPRLWIVPSWAPAPDPRAVNILLDPGLAFGTGSHATTRLALRWLERAIRGGESVIDYGCGSGILAIAAMKLGAAAAVGVDIDEQALLAARRNAVQNQVDAIFHAAAEAIRQPAQIVVANILAHPLIVLAPLLAQLTAPGGRLALAGLLAAQVGEVSAAYRERFDLSAGEEDEGWVLLGGVRR
ncbi:MAG: 50S ribosomal protein L11 methyltransferase [Betaproteobacteria bacterium]|nr:50S ribosomal protein L11 methyltransferase [Betaproteobacteria bacterium]MBI2508957.1 50S ribosomal protein L11 methyltransferase [Betaproteobacteria bacterium]